MALYNPVLGTNKVWAITGRNSTTVLALCSVANLHTCNSMETILINPSGIHYYFRGCNE
jgi:hypothetical protein